MPNAQCYVPSLLPNAGRADHGSWGCQPRWPPCWQWLLGYVCPSLLAMAAGICVPLLVGNGCWGMCAPPCWQWLLGYVCPSLLAIAAGRARMSSKPVLATLHSGRWGGACVRACVRACVCTYDKTKAWRVRVLACERATIRVPVFWWPQTIGLGMLRTPPPLSLSLSLSLSPGWCLSPTPRHACFLHAVLSRH